MTIWDLLRSRSTRLFLVPLCVLSLFVSLFGGTIWALTPEDRKQLSMPFYSSTIEEDCSAITHVSGSDNIARIFNFFLEKGLTDFQIAGILGNMKHESGIEPQRLQGTSSGIVTPANQVPRNQAEKAWGLVQWDRAHKMIDPVTAAGRDPNDIGNQLEFLWGQLTNTWPEGWGGAPAPGFNEKSAGDHLRATTDVASATLSFETRYERHAGPPQPQRIVDAEEILNAARASGASTADDDIGDDQDVDSVTTTTSNSSPTNSCGGAGGSGSGQPYTGEKATSEVDTSNVLCAGSPTGERIVTIAGGTPRKLCEYGDIAGVDASWSDAVSRMIAAAAADGISLGPGGGFREAETQIRLRRQNCGTSHYAIYEMSASACRPPTARPGRSNHELGLAIDFSNMCYPNSTCNGNSRYDWLMANAGNFGIRKLSSEAWHWSIDGN